MIPSNSIRYFRDCYEEDNRRSTLWNIFQESVTHRLFAEREEELLNGFLTEIPLDPDDGRDTAKAAYLYQKEKELVYCSLFVVGRLRIGEEGTRAICAPIVIHPAEIIEQDPHAFLRPDLETRRINYHLLDALESRSNQPSLSHQAAELLNSQSIAAEHVFELSALLEATVPELNPTELRQYPKLASGQYLRELFARSKDPESRLTAVSSSVAALIPKSVETRGVFNELSEIAEAGELPGRLSEPLTVLLSGSTSQPQQKRPKPGRVPAVLNTAQQNVLGRGSAEPLTLVIGPPGTGKSFTIAALAVEHLSRGQSVLIASKMDHAVDVVEDKIEALLGTKDCAIRGGRKHYLKDLKRDLEQLLSGMRNGIENEDTNPGQLEKELLRLDRDLERIEQRIHRRNAREVSWGRVLSGRQTFFQQLMQAYINYRVNHQAPLWELSNELECLLDLRTIKTSKLVQSSYRGRLRKSLEAHRAQFADFLRGIRARTGTKQEDIFGQIDFKILLSALPIWLVNLADIQDVLPLREDLFDLAIIDEASQCDIASCLPIFQRSRRVVISGDPNQLRHLSFLPSKRQQELFARYNIDPGQSHRYDYRGNSILDLVSDTLSSQSQVIFLDEHYRSLPPIIEFSNARFYGGSLRIMTDNPVSSFRDSLTHCPGEGQRNSLGVNEKEAQRLISDCLAEIESEKALAQESRHSIGVLSPFRGQADFIAAELGSSLPLAVFESHNILIGTAHSFQGEERDIVYISLGVDPSTHPAAVRFLEKPDVFNVSITRARVAQHIYTSIDPNNLDMSSLLGAYLRYVEDCRKPRTGTRDGEQSDPFVSELREALNALGYQTWTGYRIAGMLLDLVVAREGRSCGIDLIGYPGPYQAAFPIERYKMFHRAGLRIIPITYTLWRSRRDDCLREIDSALSNGSLR